MNHDLKRLTGLTSLERGFLIHALFLLPVIGWGLRMVGFRKIQSVLHRSSIAPVERVTADVAMKTALVAARMVSIAARRGLYRANCLPKSMALVHLLGKQGIATDLQVGVRKVAGVLEAHAWVELHGQPLNDDQDVHNRFPAFDRPINPLKGAAD